MSSSQPTNLADTTCAARASATWWGATGGPWDGTHDEPTLRMEGGKPAVAIRLYPCALVATSHSTGAWVLELASWKWQLSPQIFCCCVVFSIGSSELRASLPRTTTPNLPPLSPTYRFPTPPARKGRETTSTDQGCFQAGWPNNPPNIPHCFVGPPLQLRKHTSKMKTMLKTRSLPPPL